MERTSPGQEGWCSGLLCGLGNVWGRARPPGQQLVGSLCLLYMGWKGEGEEGFDFSFPLLPHRRASWLMESRFLSAHVELEGGCGGHPPRRSRPRKPTSSCLCQWGAKDQSQTKGRFGGDASRMSSPGRDRRGPGRIKIGSKPEKGNDSREQASTSQRDEAADGEGFSCVYGSSVAARRSFPGSQGLRERGKEAHRISGAPPARTVRPKGRPDEHWAVAEPEGEKRGSSPGRSHGRRGARQPAGCSDCQQTEPCCGSRRSPFPCPDASSFHLPW